MNKTGNKAYAEAGVNLEAGYNSVKRISKHLKRTSNLGVMGSIGSFGGLFDLSKYNYQNPILVSGTDGVGTKLMIAKEANDYHTIGYDVVAMCVNDVLAQGAKPLFFLDYIACGKNNPQIIEEIVSSICDGLELADCALIGGETAEMPDMYAKDEYDIAGFTVGAVEKENIITSERVSENDVLIGLASSGIHSNGYSLVRKILFKDYDFALDDYIEELAMTLKEALLIPTTIYVKPVLEVLAKIKVCGVSHITGGGFIENIPRCLPDNLGVSIQKDSYPILPIFKFLKKHCSLSYLEMHNVFNMGIGLVLVVKPEDVEETLNILKQQEQKAYIIGKVINKEGVHFE